MDLDFTFENAIDASSIVRALVCCGMKFSAEGKVAYLIDEKGMFDWQHVPDSQFDDVISKIGDFRWIDQVVGVTLYFPDGECGGDLLFHPGRITASFVIGINPKRLSGSRKFCDLGWYLMQLIPPLESLGLTEIEARDVS